MSEEKDTTEIPVAKAEEVSGERQAAKCCGCCCDYRRCVIILGVIAIVIDSIYLVLSICGASGLAIYSSLDVAQDMEGFNADDAKDAMYASIVGIIVYGIALVLLVIGLIGAVKFNFKMVFALIIYLLTWCGFYMWYMWEVYSVVYPAGGPYFTTSVACGWIWAILWLALYFYPVVGLILEIKNGILTKETYPKEAYSCCCEPKV